MKHLRSNLSSLFPLVAKNLSVFSFASVAIAIALLLATSTTSAQNIISTYAGGGTFPVGGVPASSVDLPGPTAAIRDASGNTYIAAPSSTNVFELTNGLVQVYAGQGYGGYAGDNGPVSQSVLALPTGLNIDSKGNIYIVDPGNSRVRIVNPSGTINIFAGGGKNGGTPKCEPSTAPCGDNGPADQALLNLPQTVAFDAAGNVYIADSFDNRIRVVNTQNIPITVFGLKTPIQPGNIATVAGSVNVPSNQCTNPTSACGDDGPATSAFLYFPEGVAFDSAGNMYIADTRDNRIRMVNPSGIISAVVGMGSPCLSPAKIPACGDTGPALNAKLHMPTGVVLDASNNIYIADSQDFRVRKVTSGTINTIAGNGVQGYSGDGGAATSAEVNLPNNLFLDSSGNLLIADMGNQVVRQVTPAGIISTIAGGGSGGDGGTATSAFLANPFNVAEDNAGNLYIADTANNRIRAINTQTAQITVYGVTINPGFVATVAGNGRVGVVGDGGPAINATLNGPTGVAIDTTGNLYIADAGNLVIRQVNSTGTITRYAGQYGVSCAPNKTCGIPGLALDASFSTPQAVAVDSAGNLYIVDYTKMQVREVIPSASANQQMISNFAGSGVAGLTCKSGPATDANLNHPSGVAVDSADNVYIDVSYSNIVCKVTGGQIGVYAFSGAGHFGGDGGPALDASQWNPLELSIDPSGNLFIGGGNNTCIRRVDSVTYTIGTVAGNVASHCSVGGYSGDGGPATSAKIAPQGLVVDGNSNLYLADNNNNRIRYVHLTPAVTITPPPNFGPWMIGQTSGQQSLIIESSGGEDLSLIGLSSIGGTDAGEFTETGTTCGSTFPLAMGVDTTCTVSFTFTPKTYGQRTATFTITDNDPTGSQTITLSGDGPYFSVAAVPPTLTINPGSSGSTTLTLTTYAGFNNPVTYSVTSCPSFTCTLTPSGQNSILTITVPSNANPGNSTVQAKGTWEALQSWVNIKVTIP